MPRRRTRPQQSPSRPVVERFEPRSLPNSLLGASVAALAGPAAVQGLVAAQAGEAGRAPNDGASSFGSGRFTERRTLPEIAPQARPVDVPLVRVLDARAEIAPPKQDTAPRVPAASSLASPLQPALEDWLPLSTLTESATPPPSPAATSNPTPAPSLPAPSATPTDVAEPGAIIPFRAPAPLKSASHTSDPLTVPGAGFEDPDPNNGYCSPDESGGYSCIVINPDVDFDDDEDSDDDNDDTDGDCSEDSGGTYVRVEATDDRAAEVHPVQTPNPGEFTITRTGGSHSSALTVHFIVSGTGYVPYPDIPRYVTIPAGTCSKTIIVDVLNDQVVEDPEQITISVVNRPDYTPAGNSATITIADNDQRPYMARLDDNAGKGGYNLGKITLLPSVPMGSVFIEPEDGRALYEPEPSANHATTGTMYPGDFFYFPPGSPVVSSIPEHNPGDKSKGVVKVSDGHSITVDYLNGVYYITKGPTEPGASWFGGVVMFVDPEHDDHKQPPNPL